MNLSKVKRLHRKARRTMYAQAPDMRGATSLVHVTKNTVNHKPIRSITHELYGQVTFHLGAGHPITIHAEPASMGHFGAATDYLDKLHDLIHFMSSAFHHLHTKNEDLFVCQKFLNNGVNNEYGSTLFIRIPKKYDQLPFCVFEISSCHFKVRLTPERAELKKLLKFFIKVLDQHNLDYGNAIEVLRSVR
ncbi:hypothetical protein pETSU_216 [Edwardsiella phage pEt-SU]|uniref:Uncharacterized protein n=1 Tax=Edwardsiella phage pEt-SU TaxID=2562142 RepID=A0A4D6DYC6_9CAUD|nr:hypothetical protein HOV39_gp216 [Edwardsiella phage pEt-SU]QBZ70796.1 hypothetical protein pETSU_216 [Edwardsiella phage pEt-SU]